MNLVLYDLKRELQSFFAQFPPPETEQSYAEQNIEKYGLTLRRIIDLDDAYRVQLKKSKLAE